MTTMTRGVSDAIRDEYSTLAEGLSARGVCPGCDGGSSREASLSVRRDDNLLLFKCHRAGCPVRGRVAPDGNVRIAEHDPGKSRRDGRERYDALRKGPLPKGVEAFFQAQYHLNTRHFSRGELRWTTDYSDEGHGRVVMPVRDSQGTLYGFTARKLDDQRGPKTLSFLDNSRGSWYKCQEVAPWGERTTDLLIVEDQLSAIKASDRINTVALLGTDMSDSFLNEVVDGNYDNVYLALDKDAYQKAIGLVLKHRHRIPNMTTMFLKQDLKDMPYAAMCNLIDGQA